ncbi:MAG: hypothetical protein ACK6A8_02120, partial [Planctomycetota bacterium]
LDSRRLQEPAVAAVSSGKLRFSPECEFGRAPVGRQFGQGLGNRVYLESFAGPGRSRVARSGLARSGLARSGLASIGLVCSVAVESLGRVERTGSIGE